VTYVEYQEQWETGVDPSTGTSLKYDKLYCSYASEPKSPLKDKGMAKIVMLTIAGGKR